MKELSRTIKSPVPQIPEITFHKDDYIQKSYRITVVTPLFGGGTNAGKVDEKMPIRGTSIRGQLRFWWRATIGQRYETPEELAQAEGEIWGTTEKASAVKVKVTKTDKLSYRNHDKDYEFSRYSPEQYALFSAKQNKNNVAKEGFTFNLEIAWEKRIESEDVLTALKAWVNFGGIGARTRRGCGSLYCPDLSPSELEDKDILEWLETNFGEYLNSSKTCPWPTMAHTILTTPSSSTDNLKAWKNVITLYQKFRQGKNVGRNPGQSRWPGRSRWPEPDAIRRIANTAHPNHRPNTNKPSGCFPRAAFGLPIITKFKDEKHGDPEQTELYPVFNDKKKDRMASPLILKPLAVSSQKGFPIAIQLRAPLPEALELKGKGKIQGSNVIINPQAAKYHNSPMGAGSDGKPRSAEGDALEAFMSYMKENGFTEVKA